MFESASTPARNTNRRSLLIAVSGLILLVTAGVAGVLHFIAQERERDLLQWQDKLGVVADSRFQAVQRWLSAQFDSLTALADNTSLQLYLTQVLSPVEEEVDELGQETGDGSERIYLRDLLVAAAARSGFTSTNAVAELSANVAASAEAGLALLGPDGEFIVSTRGLPLPDEAMKRAIHEAMNSGGRALRDIFINAHGHPAMAFFVPVQAFQADSGSKPIGMVMGVKPIGKELYPLLKQKGLTAKSHETLLLRQEDGMTVYLSPQADGTNAMERRLKEDPATQVAGQALAHPFDFHQGNDYRGKRVLAVSRAFDNPPWVLLHKVDRDEAMAESDARAKLLLYTFLSVVAVIALTLIAAWKHGSSVRFQQAAEKMRHLNEQLRGKEQLLTSITENVTDYLMIIDNGNEVIFANRAVGKALDTPAEELAGKTLAAVFGPHVGEELEELIGDKPKGIVSETRDLDVGDRRRTYEITVIPLDGGITGSGGVLLVMDDITELMAAEKQRARVMWQLVSTLTGVLDQHDPWSANHSKRMVTVCMAVAEQIRMTELERNAVRMAASLLNMGKITIPKEVLTKEGKLTDEEFAMIRGSVAKAVEMLSQVEFDGPVLTAMAQSTERLDGSGYPQGLKGDEIILPARILAVANSFVAMVTSRSFRKGMGFDKALDRLMQEAGSKYDRRVLAALFDVIENQGGREWERQWQAANE